MSRNTKKKTTNAQKAPLLDRAVISLMPMQVSHMTPTPLVAANIAITILDEADEFTPTQALRFALTKFNIGTGPGSKDHTIDNIAAGITQRIAQVAQKVAGTPRATRDFVVYNGVLNYLNCTFGKTMSVTGWLQGKRVAITDRNGKMIPVSLTGKACPSCSINPVAQHENNHEHIICIDQTTCGWKMRDRRKETEKRVRAQKAAEAKNQ